MPTPDLKIDGLIHGHGLKVGEEGKIKPKHVIPVVSLAIKTRIDNTKFREARAWAEKKPTADQKALLNQYDIAVAKIDAIQKKAEALGPDAQDAKKALKKEYMQELEQKLKVQKELSIMFLSEAMGHHPAIVGAVAEDYKGTSVKK